MSLNNIFFKEILRTDAPHLFDEVRHLSQKAGIQMPKILFSLPQMEPNAYKRFVLSYLGGALPSHSIIFGPGLRKLLDHTHPHDTVSREFSAVIAHELAHLKYRDLHFKMPLLQMGPMIGLALAVGGLAYYRHFHRHPEQKKAVLQDGEPDELHKNPAVKNIHAADADDTFIEKIMTGSKYVGAAIAGYTAGVFASRLGHHQIEYRADRFAAELIGDGKPLARALEALGAKIEKMHDTLVRAVGKDKGWSEKQMGYFKKLINWLTESKHPPIEARIERLNNWSPGR